MQIAWPLVITVIGVILYLLPIPKVSEMGRIAFACGLLVVAFSLAKAVVHLP